MGNGQLGLGVDDYLIGAFLLYGAWRCARDIRDGQRYLAAAFAFGCGIGYPSFIDHMSTMNQPDVGHIPHVPLAIIIGLMWALGLWCLVICLRKIPEPDSSPKPL